MPPPNEQILKPFKSVVSASWLYPFKGIYFFATHPAWWPLLGRRLIPLVVVSIVVFGFLFTFAYLPQVAFLALFGHGPGAFLNATFLVLGEGAVIVALLFEALLVDETLVDVFDAVCTSSLDLWKICSPESGSHQRGTYRPRLSHPNIGPRCSQSCQEAW